MAGKKKREKSGARLINVEIAPGNKRAMEDYIAAYNGAPSRTTPKITYTDVVNEAIDRYLRKRSAPQNVRRPKNQG